MRIYLILKKIVTINMNFSDMVTIHFFCIETNEWVRFWAPGNSGPKPSTLPLPPSIWTANNVMNNVNLQCNSDNGSETDDD